MPPRRGAPTLGARARKERITKGLTQRDAGELIGRSQAHVSQLEADERPDEIASYREALSKAAPKGRTAGGSLKAGRATRQEPEMVNPASFRGDPLDPDFDYASILPRESWSIMGICRTAPNAELAFLSDEDRNRSGIIGFYRKKDGAMWRTRVITITQAYDNAASIALEAFANGSIEETDVEDDEDDDLEDDDLFEDE